MAKSLNIVIGADIEKLREGFNKAIEVVQKSSNQMSAEVAKSAKGMEERLAAIATRNPTMGSVRQLTQLAMEARALGPEFANVANEIIKQAGRMKDAIGDARAEVGYFSSDTRRLDAVLGGVQALAGGFGAMEGALQLAGIGGKDLQEAMVKLQSTMAIVNGLQAIGNALQEESAVRQGLSAAATSIYAAATNGATVATRALNLALSAGPWVLLTASIAAVSMLLSKLASETAAVEKNIERLKEAQNALLSNGEKKIKLEERRLEIAIATAKAEGKSEAFILELKRKSLETQKGLYKKAGEDALILLNQRRSEELRLAGKDEEEKKNIYARYEKESIDIRTRLNEEYQNKLHAFQLDEIESHKAVGKQKVTTTKAVNKELTKENEKAAKEAQKIYAEEQAFISGFKPLEQFAAPKAPTVTKFRGAYASNDMTTDLQKNTDEQVKIMTDYEQKMADATNAVNNSFATLQTDAANSFAQFIADTAEGDKNAGANFGKSMMGAIANFMQSVGAALVTTAIASKAFKELIFKEPLAAAAAGVALVAGAAILRAQLSQGPKYTAFADGGIVSGPTLGLMGEYPGASTNPEIIAPLDKLKGMLNTGDNTGYIASTQIQGRDLAIVLERYNKDSRRG